MKKVLIFLCVMGILLMSTMGALAEDPKAVPGTGDSFTPTEQSISIIK